MHGVTSQTGLSDQSSTRMAQHYGGILQKGIHAFHFLGFPAVLVVKNLPDNAEEIKDMGSISGSGRSPGGGHGNLLQYSCLENPMDRGALQTSVHGVAKSDMTEAA